ncbi:MAG: TIR domain-containing protein [Candidatus Magnetomorum sp.]|nr:TIR domain-containing protein [Candidatus Magnetomorum sp.]
MKCVHCKQEFKIKKANDSLTCPNCKKRTYIIHCSKCSRRFYAKQYRAQYICKICTEKQTKTVHPKPQIEKQSIEKRAVFISYSHKDKEWLDQIKKYLDFYKNQGLTVWTDQELRAGDQWNTEIETAITRASISILLISIDFFNSTFIMKKEIPWIKQQFKTNDMRVIPIIVSQCPWNKETWIQQHQVLPQGATPLNKSKDLPQVLTDIADKIFRCVQSQPQEKSSKSYGTASSQMCNRIPQMTSFLTTYQVNRMPQFYFIHGREQDQHQSLVDRYKQTIISKRLEEVYETTKKPFDWKYVFKPYSKQSDKQQETMLYDMGIELTGDETHGITTFENFVNSPVFERQQAIIISHKIEADLFHKALLTWYIQDFWTKDYFDYIKKYNNDSMPQFILFFNIIFESGFFNKLTNRKKKMIKCINDIAPENSTFVLIPELELVTRQAVESWFNSYTRDLKDCLDYETKKNDCIKQLFPNPKSNCPMAVVEEKLKNFSRQF